MPGLLDIAAHALDARAQGLRTNAGASLDARRRQAPREQLAGDISDFEKILALKSFIIDISSRPHCHLVSGQAEYGLDCAKRDPHHVVVDEIEWLLQAGYTRPGLAVSGGLNVQRL